jgi:hypothetical protein
MFFPALDAAGAALLDAFEQQLRADPGADLASFLPPAPAPGFLAVATELARVDMEYARRRGSPRPPDYYLARIPGLRDSARAVAALAFEDYRLRRLDGEPVAPDYYAQRYGVSVAGWPRDPRDDRERPDPLLGEDAPRPGRP